MKPSSPARAWHRWPARPSRLCSVPTPPRTCPSSPPHPKIRPELSEILEAEAGMPGLAELEAEAAEATERIRLRITDDVEFEG